jgi:amine acid ABC transporter, permease protein, 3-TM region, His/Glu/Gln/Arg/opine family
MWSNCGSDGLLALLDFSVFFSPSPEAGANYLTYLLRGAFWTVVLSCLSWVIAFVIGSVVGVLRTLPSSILSKIGACYVEIFRNIPLLVQLFIWFIVVPELVPGFGPWFKHLPSFWQQFTSATFCLGLFTAARIAEQVRSGLCSLGKGQFGAGLALGLNIKQVYGLVLLPVAYRIIIPTLTSEFLNLIKNSAVASTIGFVELARRSDSMAELKSTVFEALLAGTLLYGVINLIILFLSRALEHSTKLPGLIGAKK